MELTKAELKFTEGWEIQASGVGPAQDVNSLLKDCINSVPY
jgi:hypothetical protein